MKINSVIVNSVFLFCCSHTACFAEPEAIVTPHPASTPVSNQVQTSQNSFINAGTSATTRSLPKVSAGSGNDLRSGAVPPPHRIHKIGIPGLFHIDFGSAL